MEEENKKIVEEQDQVSKISNKNDEKYLKLKGSNSKKNAIIIVLVFVIILLLGLLLLYYFNHKDDNQGGSETPVNTATPEPVAKTLSDDEAIKIAKEKHNDALNLIVKYKDGHFDTECTNKNMITINNQSYCYYGEEKTLEENFYKMFSRSIDVKDVYNFGDKDPDDISVWKFNYVVKNGKVYFDTYCRASGNYSEIKDYKILKNTSDMIEVSYTIHLEGEPGEFEEKPSKIVLVRENGEWKISYAALLDRCHNVYVVGKES